MKRSRQATDIDPKHKRLADRYLLHLNAARAARECGYAQAGARARAGEILARPEVRAYVDAETTKLDANARIARYLVCEELAILAHSNIRDFVIASDGSVKLANGIPDEAWRAVRSIQVTRDGPSVTTKIRLWPKADALRMAGEHLGMFRQIIENHDKTLETLLDELDMKETREQLSAAIAARTPGAGSGSGVSQ